MPRWFCQTERGLRLFYYTTFSTCFNVVNKNSLLDDAIQFWRPFTDLLEIHAYAHRRSDNRIVLVAPSFTALEIMQDEILGLPRLGLQESLKDIVQF